MIAKYSGRCSLCGKPIPAGTDCHYEPQDKTVQCWDCIDNPKPTDGQRVLADRLGFMEPGDVVTVKPADDDDPVAQERKGQQCRVLKVVQHTGHIGVKFNDTSRPVYFRPQDLRK